MACQYLYIAKGNKGEIGVMDQYYRSVILLFVAIKVECEYDGKFRYDNMICEIVLERLKVMLVHN